MVNASDFLNADTLLYIEQKRGAVRSYASVLHADMFPDQITRAFFYETAPRLLEDICDMMAGYISTICKHNLHEHEYADEVQDASVRCYAAATNLKNEIGSILLRGKL